MQRILKSVSVLIFFAFLLGIGIDVPVGKGNWISFAMPLAAEEEEPGEEEEEGKEKSKEDKGKEDKKDDKECKGKECKNKRYLRREFSYTKFHQTLGLPENADKNGIEATVKHGVLHIIIPKLSTAQIEAENKVIEVK